VSPLRSSSAHSARALSPVDRGKAGPSRLGTSTLEKEQNKPMPPLVVQQGEGLVGESEMTVRPKQPQRTQTLPVSIQLKLDQPHGRRDRFWGFCPVSPVLASGMALERAKVSPEPHWVTSEEFVGGMGYAGP
jgi:hypothetical protein